MSDPENRSLLDNQQIKEWAGGQFSDEIAPFWLSALVESAEDAIISKTLDSVITSWNQGAERIFGYEAEEVIGKKILILIPPHLQNEENVILQKIETGGRIEHYETVRLHKNGTLINVSLTVSPIKDAQGRIIGASKIARDITNLKRAEEKLRASEKRYRSLFDSLPIAIYACDGEGIIQEFNQQAAELWGRLPRCGSPEEKFCGSFKIFYPDGRPMPHEECPMAKILRGETVSENEREILVERPDGKRRNVMANPVALKNQSGEIIGAINCLYDITERKKMERALVEADRRKDAFLATLAHELRNPLAPIKSGLELIQRFEGVSDKVKSTLDIVERQTDQIIRLVDDLLDISRITLGKVKLRKERIELKTAVEMAVETCRDALESNNHRFTLTLPGKPLYVDADLTRVTQIILNVLNNAAKYTPPGGKISLTVAREGVAAVIIVRDSGIGIPKEMLPKIFDIFHQFETADNQSPSGLGIGLSVARDLTEMHGGTLTAASEGKGRGSEFVIRLPLAAEQSALDNDSERRRNSPANKILKTQGKRILVVDDNVDAAEMLKFLLATEGYHVETVFDAETALETAKTFNPSACLCDIGLPRMNGYELARQLRQMLPQSLLISISGWGQEEDRHRSLAAGFNHHLVKPVEFETLMPLVEQINEKDNGH